MVYHHVLDNYRNPENYRFNIDKMYEKVIEKDLILDDVGGELYSRTMYNLGHGLIGENDLVDKTPRGLFNSVLYYPMEDTNDYNSMHDILAEFLSLDMYKTLGISIIDYLNTTTLERLMLKDICEIHQQKIKEALDDAKKKSDEEISKVHNNIVG